MASHPEPKKSQLVRRPFEDFMHLVSPGPRIDIIERGDDIVIQADVPGMSPDDIKIALHDDVLVLSGERNAEREHHEGSVVRAERTYGAFSRMIHLPHHIDGSTAESKLENGVLEITVKAKR